MWGVVYLYLTPPLLTADIHTSIKTDATFCSKPQWNILGAIPFKWYQIMSGYGTAVMCKVLSLKTD